MKFHLNVQVLLFTLLLSSSLLQVVNGQSSDTMVFPSKSGSLEGNIMDLRNTQRMKKPYSTEKPYQKPRTQYDQSGYSNLCPCHLYSAQGSACYHIMNQAAGTCRKRTCTDGFVCTSRAYATHYCFEKTKYTTKVVSIGGGRCTTIREWQTFRVPYVDIVTRGDEREQELNYNTLMRDDLGDMEPGACYQ